MRTFILPRLLLLLAALAAFALAACDSALDKEPTSFIGPDNFYNNAEDALAALNGAYRKLNTQDESGYLSEDTYIELIEIPGPTTNGAQGTSDPESEDGHLDNWTWEPTMPQLLSAYRPPYQGINAANAVIQNVPGIENMDPQLRERIVGEARFLRALHYFYLVRVFGGVPLVRTETTELGDLEKPPAPEDSIYIFTINDLETAIPVLPPKSGYSGTDQARASKGAAKTLLAKVYLRRASLSAANGITGDRQLAQPDDYQEALDLINEVINSGEYSLPEDVQAQFRDMFIETPQGQNEEIIFAIQRDAASGDQGVLPCFLAPSGSSEFGSAAWTNMSSELPFYNSFENADLRKEVSFITEYGEGENRAVYDQDNIEGDGYSEWTPTPYKYAVQDGEAFCNDNNDFVLLRYADLLLMKAEAINEMNQGPNVEAFDAINQVRERAGLEPLSGMGYEAFREALYEERNRELFFEAHSFFDVQRYFDVATKMIREHAEFDDQFPEEYDFGPIDPQINDPENRLMPFPQRALERNPELTQNPGYN